MTLDAARREKNGHGFAGSANAPVTPRAQAVPKKLLIIVPGSWKMEVSRQLLESIRNLGHDVVLLRNEEMRPDDIPESMVGREIVFLYETAGQIRQRTLHAAQELNIPVYMADIEITLVVEHVQRYT